LVRLIYNSEEVRYKIAALVKWLLSGQHEETWKKTAVVAFHPPWISHEITSTWIRGSSVRRKRISTWAVACPRLMDTRIYARRLCVLIGRYSTLLVWCTVQSCRKPADWIHLLLNQASGNKGKSFPFAGDAERKLKLVWEFEFGILVLERVNISNVRSESFLTSNFRPSHSDLVGFRSGDGTRRHLCHHVTAASTRQNFDMSFCPRL